MLFDLSVSCGISRSRPVSGEGALVALLRPLKEAFCDKGRCWSSWPKAPQSWTSVFSVERLQLQMSSSASFGGGGLSSEAARYACLCTEVAKSKVWLLPKLRGEKCAGSSPLHSQMQQVHHYSAHHAPEYQRKRRGPWNDGIATGHRGLRS